MSAFAATLGRSILYSIRVFDREWLTFSFHLSVQLSEVGLKSRESNSFFEANIREYL